MAKIHKSFIFKDADGKFFIVTFGTEKGTLFARYTRIPVGLRKMMGYGFNICVVESINATTEALIKKLGCTYVKRVHHGSFAVDRTSEHFMKMDILARTLNNIY